MRWEVAGWGGLALLLFAAEAMAPGAFMLWMGFAAVVVFVSVVLIDGIPLLLQVVAFIVLSFVSIQIYRRWFRSAAPVSDRPLLNRRAEQLIGRLLTLDQAIVGGTGRARVDDAIWVVSGEELPAGAQVRVVAVDGLTLSVRRA